MTLDPALPYSLATEFRSIRSRLLALETRRVAGGGASSATPGGSAGSIQYSDGSTFDGDTNLVWDSTNVRLGIGTSSPTKALDVVGDVQITGVLTTTTDANVGGKVYFGNSALIASEGSSSNIDHLWHDDAANAWNFCSDTTYRSAGNSTLVAGAGSFSGTVTASRFSGSGASLTSLNASNLSSGTVPNSVISGAYSGVSTLTVTSGVVLPDGSSGTPCLRFSSDTNTGFYRYGADQIGITCGSTVHSFRTDGLHLGSGDWFRSYGNAGLYCATYGGGIYMVDSDWVRTYNGKGFIWEGIGAAGPLPSTSTTSGYRYVVQSTAYSGLAYYTSRRSTKEQILDIENSGEIIDALRPVTFIPKFIPRVEGEVETEENRLLREVDLNYGFIAEEVAEVADGKLAQYDSDENGLIPVGWRWSDVIAVLVAEAKQVRTRLDALEAS